MVCGLPQETKDMKARIFNNYSVVIFLGVILFLASYLGERINTERYLTEARAKVQYDLNVIRDRLHGNLNSDLQIVKGLISVIASNPELDQNQFEVAARPIFHEHTRLRNIGAAPDMVIRLMYPVKGNEKAIGLDYRKTPHQFAAAEEARLLRKIVLAGPLELAQGGIAIIARVPVYFDDNDGNERFWGLISAVIDTEKLFSSSGLYDAELPIKVAILGKDAKGNKGGPVLGDLNIFNDTPVFTDIILPHGSWNLAAVPVDGWPTQADNVWQLRLIFLVISIIILGAFISTTHSLRIATESQKKAEHANQAKSQFLSHMSHELRTPMNAILGFTQLLRFSENLSDEEHENIEEILRAGYHLLELINEVLDLAKVESGQIILSLEPMGIQSIIKECMPLVKPLANQRNIRIHFDAMEETVVIADRMRLKQTLINLLSNAVKYNNEGQDVTISINPSQDKRITISITDKGDGIPESRMDDLFKPFNRLGAERSSIEGTGVGLAISKRVVEMMNGSIGVRSKIGKGSTFWIELPTHSNTMVHQTDVAV